MKLGATLLKAAALLARMATLAPSANTAVIGGSNDDALLEHHQEGD